MPARRSIGPITMIYNWKERKNIDISKKWLLINILLSASFESIVQHEKKKVLASVTLLFFPSKRVSIVER